MISEGYEDGPITKKKVENANEIIKFAKYLISSSSSICLQLCKFANIDL